MLRVKICGVRRVEDALAASDAGADAVGVNFYEGSPRRASLDEARRIADALPSGVLLVGVFVNESVDKIADLVERVPLGAVQLHGDEPPEALAALPATTPLLRALRVGQEGLTGGESSPRGVRLDRPETRRGVAGRRVA